MLFRSDGTCWLCARYFSAEGLKSLITFRAGISYGGKRETRDFIFFDAVKNDLGEFIDSIDYGRLEDAA